MKFISPVSIIVLLLINPFAYAQHTYLKQQSKLTLGNAADLTTNTALLKSGAFVGCVDYKITYTGLYTENKEQQENLDFLIKNSSENYGRERTYCFNEYGDWLHIYSDAKQIDKIWYFAETNEEYTLFKNGVMKFSVNNEAEPKGFEELTIKSLEVTEETKMILGYKSRQIVLEIESGTKTEYWVSDELQRNPASYQNNKFAYMNEIMSFVKGVHLYQKKTVANFFTTTEEAVSIRFELPDQELFTLPNVDLYHW
jgi:hypothetical protein